MEKEKRKEKNLVKAKYGMLSNVWFMMKLAWTAGEKKVLFLCLMSAVLAVMSNLLNLYVSPTILSALERHVSISELFGTIAGFVLGMMLVSAAVRYVQINTLFGRITLRSYIINLVNQKACKTSYPNVDDKNFTNLLTKSQECTCSNDRAAEAIWETLTELLTNIFGFVFYVWLLGSVKPVLIFVIMATTILSYFVTHYVNGYGYRHREEEAVYTKQLRYNVYCADNIGVAKDIRIFGLRSWIDELYKKTFGVYMTFHRKEQGIYVLANAADTLMVFLRNGIAYVYLIGLVLNSGVEVSEFLLLFSAVSGFAQWVSGILGSFAQLHVQSLDISTVRECLNYKEVFLFEEGKPLKAQADKEYEIRLEHVSFCYPEAEKDTLTDIDLTIKPGEKIAIVGLNGAGKTTLVKLICGFLNPTKGRVLLNGVDICTYNRNDYYKMFSAVFQTFSLLASTVAVNVAQTEKDIDMQRVKDCIEKAGLQNKIESLKDGYETRLVREVYEDAMLFSGGETQRLMLARALYKDASFVVLDEPTAALDPIAEADMYQKYNEMTTGKSSVYISHRLASTRFCDRIILIENGRICEEGTHSQLLDQGGKYAELYEV